MKRLILIIALSAAPAMAAMCNPTGKCTACHTCAACKNCAKLGGHCSVCAPKPRKAAPKAKRAVRRK